MNKLKILICFACVLLYNDAYGQNKKFSGHEEKHIVQIDLGHPEWALMKMDYGNSSNHNVTTDWFLPDVCVANEYGRTLPSISGSYYYVVKSWLHVGGVFSYGGRYHDIISRPTSEKIATARMSVFTLMPSINFEYFRRKYVSLYSGLSLGLSLGHTKNYEMLPEISEDDTWQLMNASQITLLGARFGAKVYGVIEYGYGNKGLITMAGVGYRF